MKHFFKLSIAVIAIICIFVACSKENTVEMSDVQSESMEQTSMQKAPLAGNIEEMLKVNHINMITLSDLLAVQSQLQAKGFSIEEENSLSEEEIKSALVPLFAKSEIMHRELLTQMKITQEWKNLTQEEQADFENLSDVQKVQMGLIMSSLSLGFTLDFGPIKPIKISENITVMDVVGCIGVALGIDIVKIGSYIFGNGSGILTAKTAVQILKAIGKRYLFGYVALAVAVISFGHCIYQIVDGYIIYNPNFQYEVDDSGFVTEDKYCYFSIFQE